MDPKVFPTILIILDLLAMIPFIAICDTKMSVYWFAAALITFSVTWL